MSLSADLLVEAFSVFSTMAYTVEICLSWWWFTESLIIVSWGFDIYAQIVVKQIWNKGIFIEKNNLVSCFSLLEILEKVNFELKHVPGACAEKGCWGARKNWML